MSVNLIKPTPGGDAGTWGQALNAALDALNAGLDEVQAEAAADAAQKATAARTAAEETAAVATAALSGELATKADLVDGKVPPEQLPAAQASSEVSAADLAAEASRALAAEQAIGDMVSAITTSRSNYGKAVVFHTGSAWPVRPAGYAVVEWRGPASAGEPPINSTYALDGVDEVVLL